MVTPLVRFEPKMLTNSPRATLPEGGTSGAALWMPVIFGACADASPARAESAIPLTRIRFRPGSRIARRRNGFFYWGKVWLIPDQFTRPFVNQSTQKLLINHFDKGLRLPRAAGQLFRLFRLCQGEVILR